MRNAFNSAKVRIRHRFRGLPIRGRYCFLHVPKTAGASISSYVFGRDLGHFRYANLADVAAGRIVLFILRDPISRFISSAVFLRHRSTYKADHQMRKLLMQLNPGEAIDYIFMELGKSTRSVHFQDLFYFISAGAQLSQNLRYIEFSDIKQIATELSLPSLNTRASVYEEGVFRSLLVERRREIQIRIQKELAQFDLVKSHVEKLGVTDACLLLQSMKLSS